ncbi:MAG: type I-E CRISPR-associated protein Cse1/CasA [Dermatophilaceae bacterium]
MTWTFDLGVRPWVPVVVGGQAGEVSLRDALIDANDIDGLDHADPLVAAAMYRLLLAIMVDALSVTTPAAWQKRRAEGRLDPSRVEQYFESHAEDFDLFHPTRPFFQVAGLESTSGRWSSPALLMPEVASGNNVPLFSPAPEDEVEPLTPAQAARRLIACHGFDTAAIKTGAVGDPRVSGGKTTGNPIGPLGALGFTMPMGRTLFDTLSLNMPVYFSSPEDRPAWRREIGPSWEVRQPVGVLDLLTWQSRRIRLLPDELDGQVVIRKVIVAAGDRMEFTPDVELHTLWRESTRPGTAATVPARHQTGRAAWRGLSAMLAASADQDRSGTKNGRRWTAASFTQLANFEVEDAGVDAFIVGVTYGNQSAVIEDVQAEMVPLPLQAVGDDGVQRMALDEAVDQAEKCVSALNALDGDLRLASGGDPVPWDRGHRPGEVFVATLDASARALLRHVRNDPANLEGALLHWERTLSKRVWEVANRLLDATPPVAVRRRYRLLPGRKEPKEVGLNVADRCFTSAVRKTLVRLAAEQSNDRKEGVA